MAKGKPFSGRVIFDHIGKTGGMAVTAWLSSVLGDGTVTKDLLGTHSNLIRQYGGLYPVISAHIEFDEPFDPRYQYITLLRNPVDRIISWLYFAAYTVPKIPEYAEQKKIALKAIRTNGQSLTQENIYNLNLSDYYVSRFSKIEVDAKTCKSNDDMQRALHVIKQYAVVGVYENFSRFLEETSLLFGLPATQSIPRVNKTTYNKKNSKKPQINQALVDFIAEINKKDLALYQEITNLKKNQVAAKRKAKVIHNVPEVYKKAHPIVDNTMNGFKSYSGEMVLVAGSSFLKPEERTKYSVLIRNASQFRWQSDGEAFSTLASYHWYRSLDERIVYGGLRTVLPNCILESGQSLEMEINVIAPSVKGKYILMLTLVREGVSWYEDKDFKPLYLNVDVI